MLSEVSPSLQAFIDESKRYTQEHDAPFGFMLYVLQDGRGVWVTLSIEAKEWEHATLGQLLERHLRPAVSRAQQELAEQKKTMTALT